jgi:uncharacterized protein
MSKTVLITGATGLIGRHIAAALIGRGDEYIALTTNVEAAKKKLTNAKKVVGFNDIQTLQDEKIDAIINLAGRNLADKRWNDKFKQEICDSRIKTTKKIVELISNMKQKPEVLISASGADYYGDTGDKDIYEDAPHANDFMGKLCNDWESEALKAEALGVRAVILRTSFVIAKDSNAAKKFAMPFRFFVGGPIGSGKQYMSWIHIDDVVGIYLFALDNPAVMGAVNTTSPKPETMKSFCKIMAKLMHRPSLFPVPGFAVKIIAGEMAQVVLAGRKALPKKIIELGYKFKFERAADAWNEALG